MSRITASALLLLAGLFLLSVPASVHAASYCIGGCYYGVSNENAAYQAEQAAQWLIALAEEGGEGDAVTVLRDQLGRVTYASCSNGGVTVSGVSYDYPDLTATVSATSATAGTPKVLSGTVTNTGNAQAVGATIYGYFDNWLHISPNADGSNATEIGEVWLAPQNAGATQTASFPAYTFPSAGIYYYRVCADLPPLWTGYVTESNDGNNCSAWRAVTVSAGAQPDLTTGSVTANPATVYTNSTVTFIATVSNTGSATASNFTNSYTQFGAGWFAPLVGATMTLAAGGTGTVSYTATTGSVPGTWQVAFCADQDQTSSHTGTITESNETNNCGGGDITWTTITISNPPPTPQPDLTAGDVTTLTSPVAGTPVTLRATITNGGTATTGAGFTNLFQIDSDSNHAVWTAGPTDPSPTLVVGGTDVTQASYTFPSSGTWYVRACADNNTSMVGTITESTETNNCGNGGVWVSINVAPAVVATALLTATPSTIVSDDSSSLTWVCGNSTSASIDQSIGSVNPVAGGSVSTGALLATTSYTLTCTPASGSPATAFAIVTVAPPTLTLTATPALVKKGNTTLITWSATAGATGCTISGPGLSSSLPSSSQTVTINNQSTYTFRCTGSLTKTVTVGLVPEFIEE